MTTFVRVFKLKILHISCYTANYFPEQDKSYLIEFRVILT